MQRPDTGRPGPFDVGEDVSPTWTGPAAGHAEVFEGEGEDAGVGLFEAGHRRVDDDRDRHALARPDLADPGGEQLLLTVPSELETIPRPTPVSASIRRPSTDPGSSRCQSRAPASAQRSATVATRASGTPAVRATAP